MLRSRDGVVGAVALVLVAASLLLFLADDEDGHGANPTSGPGDPAGATGPDLDEAPRLLAARASAVAVDQPELARRLAVAAYRTAPTPQARVSLLAAFGMPGSATGNLARNRVRLGVQPGRQPDSRRRRRS